MKRLMLFAALLLSMSAFAQTGTFTTANNRYCQVAGSIPAQCYLNLYDSSGALAGEAYFSIVTGGTNPDGSLDITAGAVYRWAAGGEPQTGLAQQVGGYVFPSTSIWIGASYPMHFTSSDTLDGVFDLTYTVTPRTCRRYCARTCGTICSGPIFTVTSGTVTFTD